MQSLGNIDDALKDQLVSDYQTADISEQDKLILQYAEKITRNASSINQEYIDSLKKAGYDDKAIHDIAQVASYFNYVNRIADSLGVEMEKQ